MNDDKIIERALTHVLNGIQALESDVSDGTPINTEALHALRSAKILLQALVPQK